MSNDMVARIECNELQWGSECFSIKELVVNESVYQHKLCDTMQPDWLLFGSAAVWTGCYSDRLLFRLAIV